MADALAEVLLRRRRLVDAVRLTPPVRRSAWQWLKRPLTTQVGLGALQADLLQRGFLMSVPLYRYCAGLNPLALTGFGRNLLTLLDAESGAAATHVPLFRGFPESVPGNTETFYVNRVFARLLQEPEQPCVLCGEVGTVHPVSPCAHLVCRTCWDGSDLGACPLCLRRVDLDDPFLEPSSDDVPVAADADRLRLLGLASDDSARSTATDLLVRRSPLSVVDRTDLTVLLRDADPSWLPAAIPVRETRAVVLAILLPAYPELVDDLIETATDALRLLYTLMNADPGLRTPPVRRRSLPRAMRRTVLARLDRMPLETLIEDLLRHERAWKRIAENLHPFEHATRYPLAALAFALLRRTVLDTTSPAHQAMLTEAARHPLLKLEPARSPRIAHSGIRSATEQATEPVDASAQASAPQTTPPQASRPQATPSTDASPSPPAAAAGASDHRPAADDPSQPTPASPTEAATRPHVADAPTRPQAADATSRPQAADPATRRETAEAATRPETELASEGITTDLRLNASPHGQGAPAAGVRLVMRTFGSRVEGAFAADRPAAALDLLRQRPGELVRRLVQLARTLPPEAHGVLVEALGTAASDVSPVVLTAALGQVRTPPGDLRLFFPRGGTSRIWTTVDERDPLPAPLAAALAGVLVAEMLRRASSLPRLRRAFLDEELTRLAAPGSERTSSSTLLRMTRGSAQPIPVDDELRLFLHWTAPPGQRVDLDLSVAVYDTQWRFAGLCDYTRLRFDQDALVHSGDLTSAPAPLGATEFVDLDLTAVRRIGGRYVLPVVFSYNNVPFGRLRRGFAGVMRRPSGLFDPAAVEERFELGGPAKILLPFGVDLETKELRWYDVNLSAAGYGHSVARYAGQLAVMAAAMEEVHGAGDRVSLWEIACWHAAARTDEVVVRCADGSVVGYVRDPAEDLTTFAHRLVTRREPDRVWDTDAAQRADFVAVLTPENLTPPPGATVYALHPQLLNSTTVDLIAAPSLLAPLTPDLRARLTTH